VHVGLNLIFLVPGETGGMDVYARELVPRLAALDGIRLTAFVNREAASEDFGIPHVIVPVQASNRTQWVRGEQLLLPRMAARAGVDLVHSLASTAPLRGRFRRVVTIHDLLFKMIPDAHFGLRGVGMRVLVPGAARTAHRIVVDAASTREDLRRHLGTPPEKIDVVPLGRGATRAVAPTPEGRLRADLDLSGRPVVLSVSAKRPHKNLLFLVAAHAALPPPRPVLVLPGYPTPHEADLRARARELGSLGDVRFPAWVSAEDLEGLYALAAVFAFPSRYEGFGLPVLEAMARGLPVVCSAGGSLAEVAGDAALLVDPDDVPGLTAALAGVLADPAIAGRLREAGRERSAAFTWEATARGTAAAYRRALAAAGPSASA